MKLKTLLCSLIVGVVALAAEKTSAFPLTLTSLTGTITSNTNQSTNTAWTTSRAKVVAVTLKQMLTVVSNEVFLQSGTPPPARSFIAFNPFNGQTYLTNTNGYFFNLMSNNIASVSITNIATTFRAVGENGGAETDTLIVASRLSGRGLDGSNYVFGVSGRASLNYHLLSRTNYGTMTITANGSDEVQGVSTGSITFTGSGTPEWAGPLSVVLTNLHHITP
jgi:hypothetical protein